MHHWLWGMGAPAFVPLDSHGGCLQPRGFGEAIEWARRNLVPTSAPLPYATVCPPMLNRRSTCVLCGIMA